jgi:hypothetical protein
VRGLTGKKRWKVVLSVVDGCWSVAIVSGSSAQVSKCSYLRHAAQCDLDGHGVVPTIREESVSDII